MGKRLALAIGLMLASLAAVQAQQASGSNLYRGLGTGTPGAGDTAGTTSKTPGAGQQTQTVPGGGIPMGAATQQDTSKSSDDPSNFDGGGRSKSR